ncbi:MAG: RNA polymerase sigma factor [Bacillota bacterium]
MNDFEKLYNDIERKLYKYVMKLCGNEHIVEEILQETFYRALCHMSVNSEQLKHSWFFTVSRNIYYDMVRKQRKLDSEENDYGCFESILGLPHIDLEKKESRMIIMETLEELNEKYRLILCLRVFDELSYSEIADKMGMSIEQVKINLFRARNKFRNIYRGRD